MENGKTITAPLYSVMSDSIFVYSEQVKRNVVIRHRSSSWQSSRAHFICNKWIPVAFLMESVKSPSIHPNLAPSDVHQKAAPFNDEETGKVISCYEKYPLRSGDHVKIYLGLKKYASYLSPVNGNWSKLRSVLSVNLGACKNKLWFD